MRKEVVNQSQLRNKKNYKRIETYEFVWTYRRLNKNKDLLSRLMRRVRILTLLVVKSNGGKG